VLGDRSEIPAYHALIIGINEYESWDDLSFPESDSRRLERVLRNYYGFQSVQGVYGAEASRDGILRALRLLGNQMTQNDSLLLFYAGHGHLLQSGSDKGGYWIPTNGADSGWPNAAKT